MKLLALSDAHGDFRRFAVSRLPDADLVVVCGDLTNLGARVPHLYARFHKEAALDLECSLHWMGALAARYARVVWVQGNHDCGVPDAYYSPAENIRDRTVVLENGLAMHGVSLVNAHNRPDLSHTWDRTTVNPEADRAAFAFGPVEVVVSHGPPLGVLDRTAPPGIAGVHIGSPALTHYLAVHRPRLVLCGHVHEQGGQKTQWADTLVVNVARTWAVVKLAPGEPPHVLGWGPEATP